MTTKFQKIPKQLYFFYLDTFCEHNNPHEKPWITVIYNFQQFFFCLLSRFLVQFTWTLRCRVRDNLYCYSYKPLHLFFRVVHSKIKFKSIKTDCFVSISDGIHARSVTFTYLNISGMTAYITQMVSYVWTTVRYKKRDENLVNFELSALSIIHAVVTVFVYISMLIIKSQFLCDQR